MTQAVQLKTKTIRKFFFLILILTVISIWIAMTRFESKMLLKVDNNTTVVINKRFTRPVGKEPDKYEKYAIEIRQPVIDDNTSTKSTVPDVYQNETVGRGPWITVPKIGRLGNNMFQFAALIAVAKHNNMTPIYPRKILDGIFKIDRSYILSEKENLNSFRTIRLDEKRPSAYDESVMTREIPANTNIKLCCYFQSWRYLEEIKEDLKRQFTFNSTIDNTALKFINQVRSDARANITLDIDHVNLTLIGVHIRRSDMARAQHLHPKTGYLAAPKQYFQNAMEYFRTKHKHVHFIICTDDIKWAQNNTQFHHTTLSIGHSPGEDLAILSHCDHIIMSTGTFSWWAGWLSPGEVLYWVGWPEPNTELARLTKPTDYFLPHWKPLL
ncbi:unnamed protein product [Owenia fusiformis]|uniref:L-Fucosyltransferase n=1 Tax=Owenia fusiformis TaxID=6347 RepID=A0A8J1U182_OWEFU|nr:unnamed protein product [Owenia fusiformis]